MHSQAYDLSVCSRLGVRIPACGLLTMAGHIGFEGIYLPSFLVVGAVPSYQLPYLVHQVAVLNAHC